MKRDRWERATGTIPTLQHTKSSSLPIFTPAIDPRSTLPHRLSPISRRIEIKHTYQSRRRVTVRSHKDSRLLIDSQAWKVPQWAGLFIDFDKIVGCSDGDWASSIQHRGWMSCRFHSRLQGYRQLASCNSCLSLVRARQHDDVFWVMWAIDHDTLALCACSRFPWVGNWL